MQRFLVHCANGFLLIVVLIGIPAITSVRFGGWRLSSTPRAQLLTFWGLALVAVANGIAALGPVKGRKERALCWKWAAGFGFLLLAEYSLAHDYFDFEWLRQALEWVQRRF